MKKLLTLTLSLLMAFSMCLTVNADNDDSGDSSTIEAKIGEQEYTTFLEAFKALKDGDTLTLEKSVTVTLKDSSSDYAGCDTSLWSEVSNVTLDLNNYTLTTISNYGGSYNVLNVFADGWTIKNGSMIVKRNDGTADSYVLAVEQEEPINLTIDNVSLSGGVAAYSTVTVTMTNTKMGTTEVAATNYYCGYAESGAKFIINGGAYTSNGTRPVFYADDDSSVEISGGNFNGSIFGGDGDLSISGGTFSNDVSQYLAEDYNVVKLDGKYNVVSKDTKVDVKENTAAVSDETRDTINTLADSNNVKDNNGNPVVVDSSTEIELNSVPKTLSSDETKKIESVNESVVKELKVDTSKEELKYIPLDITLTAINKVDGQITKTAISELGEKITVTLYLKDETVNTLKNKSIKIIRIHGDETTTLDDEDVELNTDNKVLTFKTDKFSTYTICYKDSKVETKKDESTSSNNTSSDSKVVTCEQAMNSKNWTWSESKKACVYRVSNTSSK